MVEKRCEVCGNNFIVAERDADRPTCGKSCSYRWRARNSVEIPCLGCGVMMRVVPSHIGRRKYHSKSCANRNYRRLYRPGSGKKIEKKCLACGGSFWISQCEDNLRKTCSRKCRSVIMRKIETRECVECGDKFDVIPSSEKVCCKVRCAVLLKKRIAEQKWHDAYPEKKCIYCGNPIPKDRSKSWKRNNMLCGKECQGKYQSSLSSGTIGSRRWWPSSNEWCVRAEDGKWIPEHRYIMEVHIGRKLKPSEHIHHINGDHQDNRVENFKIVTNSEHKKLHHEAEKIGFLVMCGKLQVVAG